MSHDERAFDEMILQLYDAAYDPIHWQDVLTRIASEVGAFGAQVFMWDNVRNNLEFSEYTGFGQETEYLYGAHYGIVDPRRKLLYERPIGTLLLCHEHFDERFVQRSEFYNDFLIPQGGRYIIATRVVDDKDATAIFGLHRSARQGPFSDDQANTARRIVPHVVRAARFSRLFTQLRRAENTFSAALNQVSWGVIIVDGDARILFANAIAEVLLNRMLKNALAMG